MKEIKDSFVDKEDRVKKQTPNPALDPIIDNLYDILVQLNEDINFQYPDSLDDENDNDDTTAAEDPDKQQQNQSNP